jgi:PIN domain nuclease of toxin-antitoxin system
MKILLDTHVILWWYAMPKLLSPEARELIEDTQNSLFASAVATWELCIKRMLGKISFPDRLLDKMAIDMIELPVSSQHAREIVNLEKIHKDPFDRLLIAQARVDDLPLMTRDKTIKKYSVKLINA